MWCSTAQHDIEDRTDDNILVVRLCEECFLSSSSKSSMLVMVPISRTDRRIFFNRRRRTLTFWGTSSRTTFCQLSQMLYLWLILGHNLLPVFQCMPQSPSADAFLLAMRPYYPASQVGGIKCQQWSCRLLHLLLSPRCLDLNLGPLQILCWWRWGLSFNLWVACLQVVDLIQLKLVLASCLSHDKSVCCSYCIK